MTNYEQQLLEYVHTLTAIDRQLKTQVEPLAAHLLSDTVHGEAIIEEAQKLRKAIAAALADVTITIAG